MKQNRITSAGTDVDSSTTSKVTTSSHNSSKPPVGGSTILRKVAGYLCLSIFYGIGLLALFYNIKEAGWYFVLSMIAIAALLGIAILGYFLIKGGR